MSRPSAPSNPVTAAVQALVNAGRPSRSREVVLQHRDLLLTNDAEEILRGAWSIQVKEGNEQNLCVFESWGGLIAKCRRDGIEPTFAASEKLTQIEDTLSSLGLWPGSIRMIKEEMTFLLANLISTTWPLLEPHQQSVTRAILAAEMAITLSRNPSIGDEDSRTKAIEYFDETWSSLKHAELFDRLGRGFFAKGNLLACRYKTSRLDADITTAIDAYSMASAALFRRREQTLSEESIQLGVEAARAALDAAPKSVHDWPKRSYEYGLALSVSFSGRRRGDSESSRSGPGRPEDIDQAIIAIREAVNALDPADSRLGYRSDLALLIWRRFKAFGDPADLEAAIAEMRRIRDSTSPQDDLWASANGQLGMALHSRFDLTLQPEDLDESIEALKIAAQGTSQSKEGSYWQNNLATALRTRFRIRGEAADVNDAIESLMRVVEATPQGDLPWSLANSNLGAAQMDRFDLDGDLQDVENAIKSIRASLDETPQNDAMWPRYSADLGVALRKRADKKNDLTGMDDAIQQLQQAVVIGKGNPQLPLWLANIGATQLARFRINGDPGALDSSIDAYKAAVTAMTERSADWARACLDLGIVLSTRFERTASRKDYEAAIAACERSLSGYDADAWPEHVLSGSDALGRLYFSQKNWKLAAQWMSKAVQCLDVLYRKQVLAAGREGWLARGGDTYRRAAYAFARSGELQSAIVTLERGRARGLSEALAKDQVDLKQVSLQAPEAYELYRSSSARLQSLASSGAGSTEGRNAIRAARADIENATQQIRQIPGYENFLAEPTLDEIKAAVTPGRPLVYIITTTVGSLALIASRDKKQKFRIDPVWCDAFNGDELNRLLLNGKGKNRRGYLVGQQAGAPILDEALESILSIAGPQLMAPIAESLRDVEATAAVLLPGGRLSLLPLHASLIDAFDVGYAPTTRALSGDTPHIDAVSLVGVGNPLPSRMPLEYGRLETEGVGAFFQKERRTTYLETAASIDRVLEALPAATHVHFACHGIFDPKEPLESRLELAEGSALTLRQLLERQYLTSARLVVLSACQTAISDFVKLPDEAIGLPAGCLHAGADAVVGSLWPVNDLSSALLMMEFYRRHIEEKTSIAAALRQAQNWLKSLSRDSVVKIVTHLRDDAVGPLQAQLDSLRDHLIEDFERDDLPFAAPGYWAAFIAVGRVFPEEAPRV